MLQKKIILKNKHEIFITHFCHEQILCSWSFV